MLKCASYNCNSVRKNSDNVKRLLDDFDIVFLQEIMLSKSDLPLLNDFNKQFRNIAFVKDRETEGINEGRPSKGVAIFWREKFSSLISPLLIDDACIGIILSHGSTKMLMLNVYMPCDLQTFDALDNYRSMLAKLEVIIREQNINEVVLAGDFNADPCKGRFWSELIAFKQSLSLVFVDEQLPNDSFTYLCPAKNTTSWLDHIFCTENIAPWIVDVGIDYDSAIFDHFCIYFVLEMDVNISAPMSDCKSLPRKMVKWNTLSEENRSYIRALMEEVIIAEGVLHQEVLYCKKINCTNAAHRNVIDMLFEKAKNILLFSTDEFSFEKNDRFRIIPGWNDSVKELHAEARHYFHNWRTNGKPSCGQLLDNMKVSRSRFRAALQNCKINEDQIRREKLVDNLENKNFKRFWNEVYNIKNNNDGRAASIDGETDHKVICDIFSDKYRKIFAMHKVHFVNNFQDGNENSNISNFAFSKTDINEGIGKLKCSIGMDGIHSNHLKFCSDSFSELLTQLFTSFIVHHFVPGNLTKGLINPTVKDKFGDLTCSDNYRPVMQSSVILKLFEYCILKKISPYIELSDSQHGFRSNHSTATACAVLKETIFNYHESHSDVYGCFIDISKAFDSVDHNILMNKLLERGVPAMYVNVIKYWYSNQLVQVRYLSSVSDGWLINNGVRQGGVLSGLFFGLYIDSLLQRINKSKYGCKLGIHMSNIIAYADDIVLLASSALSLQILINEANAKALELKLKFNKNKSKWIIFRAPGNKQNFVKDMEMNGGPVGRVDVFKYLGYILRSDLRNVDDIQRAMKKFYCEFNNILRKFSFADFNVKLYLFRYYCLQIYGADLWLKDEGSVSTLKHFAVGYHKAIKKILGLSSHESNHFACQEAQMPIFKHLLNKKRIMTAMRLFYFPCNYFRKVMPFLKISSVFRARIEKLSRREYDIEFIFENDVDAINSRIIYVQNHEETMR